MIVKKLNPLQFGVVLDSLYLLEEFQYTTRGKRYQYWCKRWEFFDQPAYYFDAQKGNRVVFKAGFLKYLLEFYREILTPESIALIENELYREPVPSFHNLTKQQNSDLSLMTAYSRGVNQSYTGSGKTEIIATLAEYATKNDEKCVIVTPSDRASEEIRLRIEERYGYNVSYYYNPDDTINILNAKGFFMSEKCQIDDPFWKEVKWCLCDEVEKCLNANTEDIFLEMCNCDRWYGFSATADKKSGEPILMKYRNPVINRNLNVVKYFGFSEVYHKPELKYINLVEVTCKRFWDIIVESKERDEMEIESFRVNSYVDIFFDEKLAKLIKLICDREGQMVIPLNRREILEDWLQNWWKDKEVLFINGSGYQIWFDGKISRTINLAEAKELVNGKKIRYIFGTSSFYNSLDFNGITKILLLSNSSASVVLQSIGRVFRNNGLDIFMLRASKEIPNYSRDYDKRLELILNYYSECKIVRTHKSDKDYDVY